MNPQYCCWFCHQLEGRWEKCAYNPKEKLVIVEKGVLSKTYKVNPCPDHEVYIDRVIWNNFREFHPQEYHKLDLFFPLLSTNLIPYHLKLNKKNKNASDYDDNQKEANNNNQEKETGSKTKTCCHEEETNPKTQNRQQAETQESPEEKEDSSSKDQEQHQEKACLGEEKKTEESGDT